MNLTSCDFAGLLGIHWPRERPETLVAHVSLFGVHNMQLKQAIFHDAWALSSL